MKRLLCAILLAAACGGSSKPAAEPAPPPPADVSNTAPEEPAPAPEPVATATGSGIPECDAYLALVERYIACDKVEPAARDAARQGVDAMKQGWTSLRDQPPDVRQQAGAACAQAVDALRQGAAALGCPL